MVELDPGAVLYCPAHAGRGLGGKVRAPQNEAHWRVWRVVREGIDFPAVLLGRWQRSVCSPPTLPSPSPWVPDGP